MIIQISKQNLLAGINAVQRAVSTKNIMPILTCLKMETKDGALLFTATNLEMGIQCRTPAHVLQEGIVVVHARYFGEIARKLPDTTISLELSSQFELTIRCEQSVFLLKTMNPEDFPSFPEIIGDINFSVSASYLKKMVQRSVFAAATDELRALFTGILWDLNGETLNMVGTDTHRLAFSTGPIQTEQALTGQFIIPSKALGELVRLIQEDHCQVCVAKNVVYFTFENISIYCRLLEGTFPNYQKVIPTEYTTKIYVNTQNFLDAAERIALFTVANDESKTVRMTIEKEKMIIFSKSEIGQGDEEVLLRNEGEDIQIAFNAHYLIDGLKIIDSEEVSFEFTQPLNPGIMKPAQDDSFIYLILPVKAIVTQ
jgi:DNA polymerase-3 subunit beta